MSWTIRWPDPINWLRSQDLAIWAIVGIAGWKLLGFSVLLFSAGLTNVSQDYLDAVRTAYPEVDLDFSSDEETLPGVVNQVNGNYQRVIQISPTPGPPGDSTPG